MPTGAEKTVFGLNCKLYKIDAPWDGEQPGEGELTEVKTIGDATCNIEMNDEDTSSRESPFEVSEGVMVKHSIEFDLDNRSYDEPFVKLLVDAFVDKTKLPFLCLDGDIAGPAFGVAAYYRVSKLPREEKLKGKTVYKISLMPANFEGIMPRFVRVAGS